MTQNGFGLVEFLITLVLIGVISVMSLNVIDNKIKKEKGIDKRIENKMKEYRQFRGLCGTSDTPSCASHTAAFDVRYPHFVRFCSPKYSCGLYPATVTSEWLTVNDGWDDPFFYSSSKHIGQYRYGDNVLNTGLTPWWGSQTVTASAIYILNENPFDP